MGATCTSAPKPEGSQPVVMPRTHEAPGAGKMRMPQLNSQQDAMSRCHSDGEVIWPPTAHPGRMPVRFSP